MSWSYPGGSMGGVDAGFWIAALISSALGLAVTIGVVVLIIFGIRWLIRADRNSRLQSGPSAPSSSGWGAPPRPDDPLEILRQRYARGEIDDEEYERRRKTLTGGSAGG